MATLALVPAVLYSAFAYAILDGPINRANLTALKNDKTRTDEQKLFENRCETIREHIGFENDVTGQARKYSCDVPGIGITIYAGKDLGKHSPEALGKHLTDYLTNKRGLQAKVFIQHDHPHGTSLEFYIDGRSWLFDPVNPRDDIKKMNALASEAKLILLTQERVTAWIHDEDS